MALAAYGDLVRYGVTASEPQATPFLEAAAEWVKDTAGRDWDATGAQTKTFYSARQGDLIALPDESPTGVSITVYETPTDSGRALQSFEFSQQSEGRIRLLFPASFSTKPALLVGLRREVGIGDALQAVDRAPPVRYERAVVSWTASGSVPKAVREAVALIAASSQLQAGRAAAGLKSESIGDYSYTANGTSLVVPPQALIWLRPHIASGALWPGVGSEPVVAGQQIW